MKKKKQEHFFKKTENVSYYCSFVNFGILAKYTNMFIVTFTTFNTVDFILPMGISTIRQIIWIYD